MPQISTLRRDPKQLDRFDGNSAIENAAEGHSEDRRETKQRSEKTTDPGIKRKSTHS